MIKTPKLQNRLAAGLMGLALAGSTSLGLAQVTPQNPQTFDTSIGSWVTWGGWGIQGVLSFDSTRDAANDPNSGSLRYDVPFTGAKGEQFMTFGTLANRWGWDGGVVVDCVGNFKNMVVDLRVDPSTAPTKSGNYGPIEFGLTTDGWGQVYLTNYTMPLSVTNWTHFVVPIDLTKPGVEKVNGFFVKMWSDGTYTNTMSFNVDNVWLQPLTNEPPPAPPTLSLEKPVPGLALIAATTGEWDRENIVTVSNNNYNWQGASGPVTYSFTVAKHADTAHPGFTLNMYFVPGLTDATETGADYAYTNVFVWNIGNNADGSAWSTLRYKTNAPASNGDMYGTGSLGGPGSSTTVGTWTLTFENNTSITATSPDGTTLRTNLPPEVLPYLAGNMQVYFGGMPGSPTRIGQMAVLTSAKITGAAGPNINSDFVNQPLDTNVWKIVANSPTYGVQRVTTDAAYWVNWTMPAQGFHLEGCANLSATSWGSAFSPEFTAGNHVSVLVNKSELPGPNQSYFRLVKKSFSKLQILLPGETAAPGTLTGKTGTPLPEVIYSFFDIVVNAVDENWHLMSNAPGDTITITTSDGSAQLPPDAALVGGTCTFKGFYFGNIGNYTITATDVTDSTKKADTSSSVTATY